MRRLSDRPQQVRLRRVRLRRPRGGGEEQEGGGRGGADVNHGATGAVAAGRALQADEGKLAGVAHQQAEAHPQSHKERAAIPSNPPESSDKIKVIRVEH